MDLQDEDADFEETFRFTGTQGQDKDGNLG